MDIKGTLHVFLIVIYLHVTFAVITMGFRYFTAGDAFFTLPSVVEPITYAALSLLAIIQFAYVTHNFDTPEPH